MNRRWLGVLLGGVFWSSGAGAHDFLAEKLVNGSKQALVTNYPATLNFTFKATNIHPTLPSVLLAATDNLLSTCTFSPLPPLTVPVGGNVTYQCQYNLPSYEACIALGALDTNPDSPNATVSFTNIFGIGWENSGSSQASTNVLCTQEPVLHCDDTIYISTSSSTPDGTPSGPSHLYIFDPATGSLSLQGDTALPYNALAFNHKDGFLYAISSDAVHPPELVRVDANGSTQVIAPLVTGAANSARWGAGAFLKDGIFVGFEITTNHLIQVNPQTGAVLSDMVVGTPETFRVADVAVSPVDGLLYGFNSATQRVTVVDPHTGTFSDIPFRSKVNDATSEGNSMVSAIFTAAGDLFFYGTTNSNTSRANTFYAVNKATGVLSTVATGPTTQFADGATCNFKADSGGSLSPPPVTRDRGFYLASEKALTECMAAGPIALGNVGAVFGVDDALGVLWANPAISASNVVRSEMAALTVKVAREWVTAVCNERVLGTPAPALSALEAALPADRAILEGTLQRLESHNLSGARWAVPLSKQFWNLDPNWGLGRAVEPGFWEKAR
ncbi:hypothetical protein JGU66_28320 [Myxococcaceae bacterium JPH2]|nr:hypothetical protein [Myxococcaceae bacterium JPH2]